MHVHVLLVHLGSTDVAVDAIPYPLFFGDHKGLVKFLGLELLAVL